ncbi:hypothetical protein D3OALGB2SA_2526 [Olavius algarvensis associated proteobacterium Delta 3]|nr:hypothetical protein D3OALGB2SA_2526 [Olavius algarvensis associated proteobacterium Delta 3]
MAKTALKTALFFVVILSATSALSVRPEPEERAHPKGRLGGVVPMEDRIPFKPKSLLPGSENAEVVFYRGDLPGAPPVFVIGIDLPSMRWFDRYVGWLKDRSASGLVVSVSTLPQWKAVKKEIAAKGLFVVLADGDELSGPLRIHRYPAIVMPPSLAEDYRQYGAGKR